VRESGETIDRFDPVGSLMIRERPPFLSNLWLFTLVCDGARDEKRKKEDANEAEEESHL